MKLQRALVLLLSLAVSLVFLPREGFSISAFARKYNVGCNACHWAGYRLNREGIEFFRRGHAFADDKGSDDLKNYISLNSKIRFNDGNDADTLDNTIGNTTFEYHAFAIYSGGILYKQFSYFTEIYLHEREGTPVKVDTYDNGGRSKLAEAYLQYTQGKKNYFTIRVGQIASQFFYLQGAGGRLSETRNYLVNNSTVKTNAGITNNWLPRQRDVGIEVGAHYSDLHLAFALTNGIGNKPTNVTENKGQGAKDYYLSTDYTLKDIFQVGLVYHKGKLEDPTARTLMVDDFYRVGIGFNANPTDFLWAFGTYLTGKDTDSHPAAEKNASVKNSGYALELDFLAAPQYGLAPFIKFDHFTFDGKSGPSSPYNTVTDAWTIGFTINLFEEQRGRISVEWQSIIQKEKYSGAVPMTTNLMKDQNLRIELAFML